MNHSMRYPVRYFISQLFLFVFLVLIGAGCKPTVQKVDKNSYIPLKGTAQELPLVDSTGKQFSADHGSLEYASLEYPYLTTPLMSNPDVFLDLYLYDLANKKILEGFKNFDSFLTRIDKGRMFAVFNPVEKNLTESHIFVYDLQSKKMTQMPLPFSLKPMWEFTVNDNILVITAPRDKDLRVYDIAKVEEPKKIASLTTTGRVEKVYINSPWITWNEMGMADGFSQTNIYQYNLDSKEKRTLPQEYRAHKDLVTDGEYLAYIGTTVSCNIGLKKDASEVTPDDLAQNIKKECSPGKPQQDIVITDMVGTIIKKIPLDYGALDLNLHNGLLAWTHAGDIPTKIALRVRLYDIKQNTFYEHASGSNDISYSSPLLMDGSMLYLQAPRSSASQDKEKLMMIDLDKGE